jgi:outer membrane protein TolC
MVRSQVKAGVLLPGSEDVLKAELLKTDQSIDGVKADIKAAYQSLGELIGRNLNIDTNLKLPHQLVYPVTGNQWKRPEYKVFNLQLDKINSLSEQTKVQYRPKLSAFAEGLYGRPGLNIFKDEFQLNYMVGLRLQWKLWNWNTGKRDREVLQLQKRNVEENKAAFTRNIKVTVQKDISDIQKFKNMISKDHEIIKLRQKIEQQSASQLHNGVITPTEYVTDLYSVYQARLALDEHQIQWMMAKINYLTKTGSK